MDWEDAISEAKYGMGYGKDEYIDDFSSITKEAVEILRRDRRSIYEKEKIEKEKQQKIWHEKYNKYMISKEWRILRNFVIRNFNNKCNDCGSLAECVHHKTYETLYTKDEINDLVPLCNLCHMNRHNLMIGINDNNVFYGRCSNCKEIRLIFRVDSWKTHIFKKTKSISYIKINEKVNIPVENIIPAGKVFGGFFNFCQDCLTQLNFKENRKHNKCVECFNDFVGRKNEARCKYCKRRIC